MSLLNTSPRQRPGPMVPGQQSTGKTALVAFAGMTFFLLAGCNINMEEQPKAKPLQENRFFKDGRASRSIPDGTVARGHLKTNDLIFTGKVNNQLADKFPFPITEDVLKRGQERFMIYCSVCHGPTGSGDGMVVQRGFKRPPSFHEERLRTAPAGHFFDVMTNGFGVMYSYNDKLNVKDRWAVAAYIRALQKSQNTPASQLSEEERKKLSSN